MLPNESFKNFGHPVEKDGARKDTQGVMQPPTGRGWCGQQRTLLTHSPLTSTPPGSATSDSSSWTPGQPWLPPALSS